MFSSLIKSSIGNLLTLSFQSVVYVFKLTPETKCIAGIFAYLSENILNNVADLRTLRKSVIGQLALLISFFNLLNIGLTKLWIE
jgi:hypothetical protein